MTAPATPTPPPGSPEAVAAGCNCISRMNYVVMEWEEVTDPACPLHGHVAPDADAQGDE